MLLLLSVGVNELEAVLLRSGLVSLFSSRGSSVGLERVCELVVEIAGIIEAYLFLFSRF